MQTRRLQTVPQCRRRYSASVIHARAVLDAVAVLQHKRVQDVRRRLLVALKPKKKHSSSEATA